MPRHRAHGADVVAAVRSRVTLRLEDAGHLLALAEAYADKWNRRHPLDRIEPSISRALQRVRAALYVAAAERTHEPKGYCVKGE